MLRTLSTSLPATRHSLLRMIIYYHITVPCSCLYSPAPAAAARVVEAQVAAPSTPQRKPQSASASGSPFATETDSAPAARASSRGRAPPSSGSPFATSNDSASAAPRRGAPASPSPFATTEAAGATSDRRPASRNPPGGASTLTFG